MLWPPGFIRTDMTDVLKDNVKEAIIATIPMKTFGETEDVANTVAFLASDARPLYHRTGYQC